VNLSAGEAFEIARRLSEKYLLEPSSLTSDLGLQRIYVVGSRDPYAIIEGLGFVLIRFFFVGDMDTLGKLTSAIESSFGTEGLHAVTWTADFDDRQVVLSRMRIMYYVKSPK